MQNLKTVLSDLDCNEAELSILFTDDKEISSLNKRYLEKNGPTNVLAFPISGGPPPEPETGMLGDVVISVETADKEGKIAGIDMEKRLTQLLIHGILHLFDYDHVNAAPEALEMEKKSAELERLIEEEL